MEQKLTLKNSPKQEPKLRSIFIFMSVRKNESKFECQPIRKQQYFQTRI
jgi:hypothetical protein